MKIGILDSYMIKALTEEASRIAEKAKQNASWSSKIPNAISVGQAEKTATGYQVEIEIDSREDGPAPHAAAFEYGSGLYGEEKDTYLIEAKNAPKLAIPRSRWPKYEPPPDTDPVILQWVYHPGVKARPYMKPAIESEKKKVIRGIGRAFRNAYRDSTVKVTVISA